MSKLKKRKCPICGISFIPKSEKNIYSSRKCFKKSFYLRHKIEELNRKKFPIFLCPSCNKRIELDFDPTKDLENYHKWCSFACPFCNTLMINVVEELMMQDIQLN